MGKRAAGVRVAGLDRDLAAWDYEIKRVDVLRRVAQGLLGGAPGAIGARARERSRDAGRAGGGGGRTGSGRQVLPGGRVRARVALASIGIERERAARELEAARRARGHRGQHRAAFHEGPWTARGPLGSSVRQLPRGPGRVRAVEAARPGDGQGSTGGSCRRYAGSRHVIANRGLTKSRAPSQRPAVLPSTVHQS